MVRRPINLLNNKTKHEKNFHSNICFLLIGSVSAQQNNWCSSMDGLQRQIGNDPALKLQYENYIQYCKDNEFNYRLNDFNRGVSDTIYIPVVFHIIHNGDAIGAAGGENISEAQIESQMDAFNKYFSMRMKMLLIFQQNLSHLQRLQKFVFVWPLPILPEIQQLVSFDIT
jgi:hypothetical protein